VLVRGLVHLGGNAHPITHRRDLGYGLLLKRYVSDPRMADAATIKKASWDTVPDVPVMFWSFRIMAGIGTAVPRGTPGFAVAFGPGLAAESFRFTAVG
jgi:cytochrome bd-type quinol oxidase subunit 1